MEISGQTGSMSDDSGPSLADDEATLADYAQRLIATVEAVAEPWLTRLVAVRAPQVADDPAVAERLSTAATEMVSELRSLLERDIADQPTGPLEVLRRAVTVPTQLLTQAGAPAVPRDEFAQTNFPDDVYALTPASFADIDASLHEPGLMWGAAKAHVHLRRRREPAAPTPPRVVALSVDLMDRSKISAAYPDATVVRSLAKLVEAAADADLVLVDLGRIDDADVLATIDARVVAFGSHVDEAALAAAAATGAEAIARSVFFRRLESRDL